MATAGAAPGASHHATVSPALAGLAALGLPALGLGFAAGEDAPLLAAVLSPASPPLPSLYWAFLAAAAALRAAFLA